jgi:hypothetical protein
MGEHVKLLRSAGYDAWLWVPGPDGLPAWLDELIPTLAGPTQDLGPEDLLVLPEVPILPGLDPAPGARKVLFNQNHFYTFAAAGPDDGPSLRWSPEPAIWTVSQESRAVLAALFPAAVIELIPNPVAVDVFEPNWDSSPAVAWFSRKRPNEAGLLHRLLKADPRLVGVALHPIVDESWPEVADILGRATVFVALGHTEGFGLPLAEALAAGCLVTGYAGGGGHELFGAPGAWPVPEQRPLLLADRTAELIAGRNELRDLAEQNRSWIVERYSPDVTQRALVGAVGDALTRPGAAAAAVHPARWLDRLPANFHLAG